VNCDMRRSFDGLSMMAEHVIRGSPAGVLQPGQGPAEDSLLGLGGLGDLVQAAGGGHVSVPFAETGRKEIAARELGVLLEGIDLRKGQRRKRYSLPAAKKSAQGVESAELPVRA
jgi:hypothetical protein